MENSDELERVYTVFSMVFAALLKFVLDIQTVSIRGQVVKTSANTGLLERMDGRWSAKLSVMWRVERPFTTTG